MPLDSSNYTENYLDTTTTNLALNPYGQVSSGHKLNDFQREYYERLEKPIQSKVATLAAKLHVNPHLLNEVTAYIEEWNTFAAEATLMQLVETMKRVKLDETMMEFYEAIHEYVSILSVSNFGEQIVETKRRVKETLEA